MRVRALRVRLNSYTQDKGGYIMVVSTITGTTGGKRIIRLSDDSLITLYKGELKELGIAEGEELPQSSYDRIMTEILPKRAKLRGLNLLTKRPYTEKQLRDKLKDGGYPKSITDEAIEYIKSMNCLDDYEYAKNYICYSSTKKSRKRIESDLIVKGIDRDTIDRAMKSVTETEDIESEELLIQRLIGKRHYDPDTASFEEKMKIRSYLYGKGFDMDMISRLT